MIDLEIDRIALAVHALRPDWPTASVRTVITERLRDHNRLDVAVALVWVACDSTSLTPARVMEAGPWWRAVGSADDLSGTYRPPRKAEECLTHPGNFSRNCRGCAADRLAGDEAEPAQQNDDARQDQHGQRASRWAQRIRDEMTQRRTEESA